MNYYKAIHMHPDGRCPFCHLKKEEIIKEYSHFVVIATRAPYCEDHILIIPKEHDVLLHEMPHPWHIQMFEILDEWNEKFHRFYNDTTFLLRDGKVNGTTWKSQNHLHFHLIPNYDIADAEKLWSSDRKFFNDKEYLELTKRMKEKFL